MADEESDEEKQDSDAVQAKLAAMHKEINYAELAKAVDSLVDNPTIKQPLKGEFLKQVRENYIREAQDDYKESITYQIFKILLETKGLSIENISNASKSTTMFGSNFIFETEQRGGGSEESDEEAPKVEPKDVENEGETGLRTSEASAGSDISTDDSATPAPKVEPKEAENAGETGLRPSEALAGSDISTDDSATPAPKVEPKEAENAGETGLRTSEASAGSDILPDNSEAASESAVSPDVPTTGGGVSPVEANVGNYIGGHKRNYTRRLMKLRRNRRLSKKICKVLV